MHILFSDGASLFPKWPGQHQRDSGVFAAVWEWVDHVYPRSRTSVRNAQTAGGTRVYVCGPCVSSIPHGATLSSKRPTQDRRERAVSSAVWVWLGACIPCFPTGRP